MTLETRHYIGLTPSGRLHMTLGPADPAKFKTPPTEPITAAGDLLYPVSAEIAAEWVSDDDEDETDGSSLAEWDDEDDDS